MDLFLGVDTSCYTTSVALVEAGGHLVADGRVPLAVDQGEVGLRQAEAVFQHLKNFPEAFIRQREGRDFDLCLRGVGASTRPRAVEGSYMPVFSVGASFGRSIAELLGVPFLATDHQAGHLMAGAWSAGLRPSGRMVACHVSGGTTEVLEVLWSDAGAGERCIVRQLGGSTDLSAGQFIDRIGVSLGLPFPAGPYLEAASDGQPGQGLIPSSVRGCDLSFSGPASAAERLIQAGTPAEVVAREVFACVATTLEKALLAGMEQTKTREVLLVGGVARNGYLRRRLRHRLEHPAVGARLHFGQPEFCSDNAVGVALLTAGYAGA